MMLPVFALSLLVTVHGSSVAAGFWQYGASTDATCGATDANRCGPNAWKNKNQACGGAGDQSPIDATFKTPSHLAGSAIGDLSLKVAKACAKSVKAFTEHNVVIEIAKNCPASYVATFKGKAYNLAQYNYHTPSEHTVDGAYFPMEVHHVHEAADSSLLIVAVFMDASKTLEATCATATSVECSRAKFFSTVLLGGKTEAAVLTLVGAVTHPAKVEMEITEKGLLDPYTGFIPAMDKYFFTYTGSFTTPPCTTAVAWILNPTAVTIFDSSLVTYRKVTNAYPKNQLALAASPWGTAPVGFTWDAAQSNSNRPIQPLGLRKLFYVGTLPPWDSSLSSASGTSLDSSASSSESSESDSSGSYTSSGSAASGSSGFYMAIWKWLVFGGCLLCLVLGAASAACKGKPVKKKTKKVPVPASVPVAEEEEILLPALMPISTPSYMPVSTSYMQAAPIMQAAPAYGFAAPATTAYAAPASYIV